MKLFDDVFKAYRELKPIYPKYRASNLPICPISFFIETLQGGSYVESYRSDFYFSIGTAFHSNLQKWLGRTGHLYGNWECPQCKKVYTNKMGTQICRECNIECIYQEFSFKHPFGITGHCDGVYFDKRHKWALEFKTIDSSKLNAEFRPYDHNIFQAKTYVVLFRRLLQLPIDGFVIAYFSRSDPRHYKAFKTLVKDDSFFDELLEEKKVINRALKTGDVTELVQLKHCSIIEDAIGAYSSCPYRVICFNNSLVSHLRDIWEMNIDDLRARKRSEKNARKGNTS